MRATRWHCCGAVAFWEVPRYCDVIRHSAEERPIKHTLIFYLEMVRLAMLFNILVNEVFVCVLVMLRNKKSGIIGHLFRLKTENSANAKWL